MKKKMNMYFQSSKKGLEELKKRFVFLIFSIFIFRLGSFIPIPGINTEILKKILEQHKGTIVEMFNMFSGGSFSRASIFALGIMPYISSSIIVQLLTTISSKLSDLKKDGETGRKIINQYTRYGTLFISIVQSIGITVSLANISATRELIFKLDFLFYFVSIISLVTGTMFLMWLGEKISEKGVGNGVSIIIYTGIVSEIPSSFKYSVEQIRLGNLSYFTILSIIILICSITYFVSFVERGQRKITVNYATRHHIRKIYSSHCNTHLPLKINMSGVIPAVFASSIVLLPSTIASWFIKNGIKSKILSDFLYFLQPGQYVYIFLYSISIVFFCFFYTNVLFNPNDTAENLKKSGAFIPGIRPGEKTSKYISKIMNRLTIIGSIYITFICLIPEILRETIKIPFYFGGTSLLIVVIVIMDLISQVQTIMISSQYESIMKKANLKR
ncbi:preprotein translocase subunit SecY [Candidatus Riesia sp. GBBU]|nr:preprotein translocase subunit SecY [Candidatus Riesia sp. GBBU]